MNIDDLRAAISTVLQCDGRAGQLFFLLKTDEGAEVHEVDIENDAMTELTDEFVQSISDKILLNGDVSLVSLSDADDRSNAIYHYDLPNVPDEIAKLATLLENQQFDQFKFNAGSVGRLKAVLILLGNEEHQLALYKVNHPVTMVRKDRSFSLARIGQTDRLKKLDFDVVRINHTFEFLCLDGEYYILNLKALERAFGFSEAIRNVAELGYQSVVDSSLLSNPEVLHARLSDITFARKLVQSAYQSKVLGVVENEKIISFCKNHPSLKDRFEYSGDGSQLLLQTKAAQNYFVKLLNDDFLHSELTDFLYEAKAKDSLA